MKKVLEIVELRTIENKHNILKKINSLLESEINVKMSVKIFTHATIETDYSIHIHYEENNPEKFGSNLGFKLVSYLKNCGLVNHNTWIDNS